MFFGFFFSTFVPSNPYNRQIMEIEKVYKILALAIGTGALLLLVAHIFFFPDAEHHVCLLLVLLPVIAVVLFPKKEKNKRP